MKRASISLSFLILAVVAFCIAPASAERGTPVPPAMSALHDSPYRSYLPLLWTHAEPTTAGAVRIKDIFYDGQKGRDEPDEYCELINQSGAPINLKGWRLNAGAPSQNYYFPDFVLHPGQTCRVYTNEDHPESGGLNWHHSQALWRNSGDCGYLYDTAGNEVSSYCYGEEADRKGKALPLLKNRFARTVV